MEVQAGAGTGIGIGIGIGIGVGFRRQVLFLDHKSDIELIPLHSIIPKVTEEIFAANLKVLTLVTLLTVQYTQLTTFSAGYSDPIR